MASLPLWTTGGRGEHEVLASVSASGEKILHLSELKDNTYKLRGNRHRSIEFGCVQNLRDRIKSVRTFSTSVANSSNNEGWKFYFRSFTHKIPNPKYLNSHALSPRNPITVRLPVLASVWTPRGDYMSACLLDHLCFCISRPPEGENREFVSRQLRHKELQELQQLLQQQRGRQLQPDELRELKKLQGFSAPNPTSCAERDAFMIIVEQLKALKASQTTALDLFDW